MRRCAGRASDEIRSSRHQQIRQAQVEEALQREANLAECGFLTANIDRRTIELKRSVAKAASSAAAADWASVMFLTRGRAGGFARCPVIARPRPPRRPHRSRHRAQCRRSYSRAQGRGRRLLLLCAGSDHGGDLCQAVLSNRIPKEMVLPLLLKIAEALTEVHQHGYVPRGIKPAQSCSQMVAHPNSQTLSWSRSYPPS